MSDHLTIAAVTATLCNLVSNAVNTEFGDAKVSAARLDAAPEGRGVSVFLYLIQANANYRNVGQPTRSRGGDLRSLPRQVVDLYYLVTFFGNERELEPLRMFGLVSQKLLSTPVMTAPLVSNTLQYWPGGYLQECNLGTRLGDAQSLEDTPSLTGVPLSLEELSKLWSVFFQTPYRLSVAYMVSPVVLDAAGRPPAPIASPSTIVIGVGAGVPAAVTAPTPAEPAVPEAPAEPAVPEAPAEPAVPGEPGHSMIGRA